MTLDTPAALRVTAASNADRDVLERLWGMFSHDLSEYNRVLPDRNGRFRQERLNAALDGEAGWAARLIHLGASPVGFAVLRALDSSPHVINSFFLVHGARRRGIGTLAVKRIVEEFPGRWSVAFQDTNEPAAAFWQRVCNSVDPAATKEHRPVPGRPELRPDTWIDFTV
ncbi:GNAT family N-acetyltransferase [Georgenia deserti]|uniref:GNAT family N-acetyltransferase n=1 Tax=Georgenia deserti TaxID=2093781 RepID=A0ABW4L6F9_9MICO